MNLSTEERSTPASPAQSIVWPAEFELSRRPVHVSNKIDLDVPPERVWERLIRATLWPCWYSKAKRVRLLEGPPLKLALDTRFHWWTFDLPMTSCVLEFVPNERIAWDASSEKEPGSFLAKRSTNPSFTDCARKYRSLSTRAASSSVTTGHLVAPIEDRSAPSRQAVHLPRYPPTRTSNPLRGGGAPAASPASAFPFPSKLPMPGRNDASSGVDAASPSREIAS
jgi:uncharacterized protein YndB with AHSA1/START domain